MMCRNRNTLESYLTRYAMRWDRRIGLWLIIYYWRASKNRWPSWWRCIWMRVCVRRLLTNQFDFCFDINVDVASHTQTQFAQFLLNFCFFFPLRIGYRFGIGASLSETQLYSDDLSISPTPHKYISAHYNSVDSQLNNRTEYTFDLMICCCTQ